MPITRFQLLLVCAIVCNCAVLFYISHVQSTDEALSPHTRGQLAKLSHAVESRSYSKGSSDYFHDVKTFQNEVTVVIMEFEDYENDIPRCVQSVLDVFPKINIVVLSNRRPYPPLDLPWDNVQLVVAEIPPDQKQSSGRPENYITTPYVLVMPDGSRFDSAKLPLSMLASLKETSTSNSKIVAVPLESRKPLQCYNLKVDLKRWTLQYSLSKNLSGDFMICDSISPSPVVILKSAFLHSLSVPYMRPFPESLFIQASIHYIHTKLLYKSSFSHGSELFTNPHNQWKHERDSKKKLQQMYKRFGIKKVERSSGEEEWYGCNKNTKRCFGTIVDDMPDFLFNNRWTPPCCLKNLKETAKYVFKIFEKSKVSYWLEGGSLLGAARYKDIIPWDYDVDIGMYKHEISKLEFLVKAEELSHTGSKFVDNLGFVWEKSTEGEFFRVQFSQFNHMHVDIFPFYERNGVMTKDTWFKTHRQDTEFSSRFLKPLTKIDFIGVKASAPNHVKEFLEFKFGKGVIENPQYPDPSKIKRKPKEKPEKKT